MTIGTKLSLALFYRKVGSDYNGNQYYISRTKKGGKFIRSVWYSNNAYEPTLVPPMWHAWLHYTTDEFPDNNSLGYDWQKPIKPNATGTKNAYFPSGHPRGKDKTDPIESDYQSWHPQ